MSDWSDRPVLVTGCTGLLGAWLVKDLVGRGARVVGLIRDEVAHSELRRAGLRSRIDVVRGSLEDSLLMERILNEYEIGTVFHLAAQTIVGTANRGPLSTFESNIRGTWTLLEACRRSPTVTRIVAASSDKAYGTAPELPYREEMPLQGRHPYDVSKSCADLICRSYFETYDLPVCITRCGNIYGGGDLNFNRLVPGTIRSIYRGERPVIRSDGEYVRDYFYVEDAVAACRLLAEEMQDPAVHGEAFNFSQENPLSVLEVVSLISELMESDLEPDVRDEASAEIRAQYLSAEKARTVLDWEPRFSMRQGIKRTIDWYEDYFAAVDRE